MGIHSVNAHVIFSNYVRFLLVLTYDQPTFNQNILVEFGFLNFERLAML